MTFIETLRRFYRRSPPDPQPLLSMPSACPLPEGQVVVFIHVPRTGGTSVELVLGTVLEQQTIFEEGAHAVARHEGLTYEETLIRGAWLYHGRRVLTGHIDPADPLVTHCPHPIHAISAVVREPVSRAVSLYDYIRSNPGHPMHAAFQGKSLWQVLREDEVFAANVQANEQTRQIFLTHDAAEAQEKMQTGRYIIGRFDHLEAFAHVLYQGVLGLPEYVTLPRLNTKERYPLPAGNIPAMEQSDIEEALALVRENTKGDQELYESLPLVFLSPALMR